MNLANIYAPTKVTVKLDIPLSSQVFEEIGGNNTIFDETTIKEEVEEEEEQ